MKCRSKASMSRRRRRRCRPRIRCIGSVRMPENAESTALPAIKPPVVPSISAGGAVTGNKGVPKPAQSLPKWKGCNSCLICNCARKGRPQYHSAGCYLLQHRRSCRRCNHCCCDFRCSGSRFRVSRYHPLQATSELLIACARSKGSKDFGKSRLNRRRRQNHLCQRVLACAPVLLPKWQLKQVRHEQPLNLARNGRLEQDWSRRKIPRQPFCP